MATVKLQNVPSFVEKALGHHAVRFALVGGVCAGVQLILLALFISIFSIKNMGGENAANLVAFFISAQLNFLLSDNFTWQDRLESTSVLKTLARALAFNAMVLMSAVVNQVTFFSVNLLAAPLIAGVAGIGTAAAANYFVSRNVIWKARSQPTVERKSEAVNAQQKLQSLAVVLPAYNEAENLPRVVSAIAQFLPQVAERYTIIVVNDGSRDQSVQVLSSVCNQHECVKAIHHQVNRGYGAALRTGFAAALKTDCEWIFFTDSDGQFDITDLTKLIPLSSNFDIVAGYRIARADSLKRRLLGQAWTLLSGLVLGLKVRDMDCAFKLIHRNALESIGELRGEAATINPELLSKASKAGFTLTQVGVRHLAREAGHQTGASLKVILMSVWSLLNLRFEVADFRPTTILNKGVKDVAKG